MTPCGDQETATKEAERLRMEAGGPWHQIT
jgi:hypothetical protein